MHDNQTAVIVAVCDQLWRTTEVYFLHDVLFFIGQVNYLTDNINIKYIYNIGTHLENNIFTCHTIFNIKMFNFIL